jgi:endonuclease V-like protein UPF0215 family
MSGFKIRHVKKEIRTLGLAARSTGGEFLIAGVVFRGNLWLDGVMRTSTPEVDITGRSVEMITTSPHHPQIRVILIHGDLLCDGITIDPCRLSKETTRPVIALNLEDEPRSDDPDHPPIFTLDMEGEETRSYSIGLESQVADAILRTTTEVGTLPEALRVVGLLLSAFTERESISFKNKSVA